MAGIQSCFRNFLRFNSSRLINKNAIQLQSNRQRHYLVFHISPQTSQRNSILLQAKLCKPNGQLLFRLASTNVTIPKEEVANIPKPATKADAVSVNSGPNKVEATSADVDESLLPPAPEPIPTEPPPDLEYVLTGLKEPTFESLELGSWWPSGILQQIYEYLHIDLGLPWWQAIAVVTLVIRLLLTPVVVKSKQDTVGMMNHLPQIHKFQSQITDAKIAGDYYAVAQQTHELQTFIQEKKINLFGFARTALIQAPIFLSMYYALNGMAKAPVESLKTEGLFWFKDLTVPDPYYALPVLLSATLLAVIEVGAEGNPARANTHTIKWLMRGIPVLVLVFTANCSACITWYWTLSNSITLLQAAVFKVPAIKKALKIPDLQYPDKLKQQSKGFIEGFKEGIDNARITHQVKDRERINMMSFERAGTDPIPRTFKKNPLLAKGK